jgi:hypothetical protein
MLSHKNDTHRLLMESDLIGNSYFGNPYELGYEQYGLEHMDRNQQASDDIESVVILGYN